MESALTELFKLDGVNTPWPVRIGDTTVEGRMGVNRVCQTKCTTKPCWSASSTMIGTVCHLGLTVYEAAIGPERVKVFGVVGPTFRSRIPSYRDYKESCKGRSVSPAEFQLWITSLRALSDHLSNERKQALAVALEPLHDAMRLARDVAQLAERAVNEGAGETAAERFDKASATQKSLVKSASLLVDTFDLLEVYLNPDAAKFGQLRSVEIYKLLDKLCKIASIARAAQTRPRVRLEGSTRRSVDVYESFKLIPFCLIDNAQKYSRQGSDVVVRVAEHPSSISVQVESDGPYIPESEEKAIFVRGHRGEAAIRAHPSGMGVGLYVCDIIARAHGTKIAVRSVKAGFQVGGVDQGKNFFSFELRTFAG